MKSELNIHENVEETRITIIAKKLTPELEQIIKILSEDKKEDNILKGYKGKTMYLLKESDIETIYAENSKIYARSNNEIYEIKNRIYELEEILNSKVFLRISNSEIVNFRKIKNLDFKISGTIILNFINGEMTYVSRRYISKIKKLKKSFRTD